jgi:CRP-like cAMP-binding protein
MSDPLFERFGREFEVGHVLFREGEPGNVMFVIQSGVIRITKRVADEDKPLAFLGAGEFLGEMAILNAKPRTATAVVAEGPARCLVIDAQTMEVMVRKNAEIALRLIKKLSKRLDSADGLIEILMHRDPKARVLLALVQHAEEYGEPTAEGIILRATPEELARQVGADASVAEQLLVRLRRLRLVQVTADGRQLVSDLKRLEEYIEFLDQPGASQAGASGQ